MKHEEKRKSLYVATHDYTTLTKVGVAVDPSVRVNQFSTQVGAKLQIYYESPLIENFLKVEANVLHHFKDKRIHGEWLNETPENIIKYIKTIENDFDSAEYTCLHCLYDDFTGEEVKEMNSYTFDDKYKFIELLTEKEKGFYITDEYKYFVFIQQSHFIYQISFNIYRTAMRFYKSNIDRAVKVDLETGEFIKNPKFRVKDE